MAKGTLVFEFESPLDLENQMRAYLRLPLLREVMFGTLTQASNVPAIEPTKAQVEEAGKIASETAQAIRTASGIAEEVRKLNQEAAAAAVAAATKVAEPVKEAVKTMVETTPAPEQNVPVPTLTLETLATTPYPDLLVFCEHNPAVGVDVSKCQASFFRKLVEMKIKTYLETK